METLGYGVKKPANGDKGSVFWPALASNAQLQNDHDHDGSDSARIPSKFLDRGSTSVAGTGWSASGNYYRKSVTMPSGYTWGATDIQVFGSSGSYGLDGLRLYPRLEKITSTTFYIYLPMSDQALTVYFI